MSLFSRFSRFNSNSPVVIKWRTFFFSNYPVRLFCHGFSSEFLYPKLILFVLGFWSSVATYLIHPIRYFTRFAGGSSKGIANDSRVIITEVSEENIKITESNMEVEEKQDLLRFSGIENHDAGEIEDEKKVPEFSFTFKFPTFEEFCKNEKDFSHLLNLVESLPKCVDPVDVSPKATKTETNSEDGSGHVSDNKDETKDDFKDQEDVNEETAVESSNDQKFEEVKEPEEVDTSMEENLKKLDDETSISSQNLDSPTNDLHFDDGFLSDSDFELQSDKKQQNNWSKSEFLSENDFSAKSRNLNENEKNSSNDTTNKLESLWEHQELIEQLKMEIKKVKATGLPTIFEESESPPKIMGELKPWKIEEVYQHGGCKMNDVHKFYKSYREKMRKLDIFNYQKMYAIGFLQLKDPLQSSSSSKAFIPEITTLLTQTFTTTKGKKHENENDPTIKFIKELQSDLEVVYVGQMCLSWEILHWQYEKALEIWESDPRGIRLFNDIADEFQQFQVLMQRFVEDESFQGPRIQSYVKNRCVFRNLLQVPVIREDHSKNRKTRNEVVCDITSDTLVEILEESIRIFWRFVRADKYKRQTPIEFQKLEDSQLFVDLQKDLHKKERKLKEQLRSGNCILKKLRRFKEEEEIEDQVLYFFCQVDMKLVSRVLQMSRLTSDQLMWCHNKLSKVSFVNRKIHVEPSFLLFPC